MTDDLILVGHQLCPYVQRAAIALTEKAVPFRRIDVDLAAKPDWFLALSPLGKTPMLSVGGRAVFESAAILEYLEETRPNPLHPADALARAEHRGWIEVASALLNAIARLYNAPDAEACRAAREDLDGRFRRPEAALGPWFAGDGFSLVDAAFGPVFRYFDVFEALGLATVPTELARLAAWRRMLAARPSIRAAVGPDYAARLRSFVAARDSHLARLTVSKVPDFSPDAGLRQAG